MSKKTVLWFQKVKKNYALFIHSSTRLHRIFRCTLKAKLHQNNTFFLSYKEQWMSKLKEFFQENPKFLTASVFNI
jgi:predicted proteasome-type protease